MSDSLEWLVEFVDLDKRTVYERFANVNDAIPFLHKVIGNGQRPRLYKETPIALTIDLDPKAPRKRKRKETKEGAADLARGETAPARESASFAQATAERTAEPTASPVSLIPTGKEEESPKEGAERRPAPSPVSVWDCEVDRYGEDGPCAGPIIFDEVTHGRFCEMHMVAAPSGRAEWHRRNAARNRPAPVPKLAPAVASGA